MGTLSYKGNLEIGTEKLPYSPQTTRHGERQSLVFCKKFCIFYFMDIFSMSNNHLFFFGGKIRTFSSELASVFFQDYHRKLCESSSEQISDIGELAKWWFSKIYFRSDNHLCFLLKKWALFYHPWPWPLCLFQDNQRKLCESSSEQMRSNHRFGRTIREHCSLNTLFIKCVHCAVYTITRERCSWHCLVNMVYSTVLSLIIVKCTVQFAMTIREPCSLTTAQHT